MTSADRRANLLAEAPNHLYRPSPRPHPDLVANQRRSAGQCPPNRIRLAYPLLLVHETRSGFREKCVPGTGCGSGNRRALAHRLRIKFWLHQQSRHVGCCGFDGCAMVRSRQRLGLDKTSTHGQRYGEETGIETRVQGIKNTNYKLQIACNE